MHVNLGGYHVSGHRVHRGFDIDRNKVGKDLAEAISAEPNNTLPFRRGAATRRQGLPRNDARRAR